MKTRHLVSILFGCLAALSVTSCLSTDDDNDNSSGYLTKAQVTQCYQIIAGNYTGNLLYEAKAADGLSTQVDTVKTSWYIPNDSTIFITSFPAKAVAEYVSNQPLKEALAKAPDQVVRCQMVFTSMTPIQFLVNPHTIEYDLEYSGSQHKVHIAFYANNTYSFGYYDTDTKALMVKMIPAALYVDEKITSYLTSAQLICFSNTHEAI